ncbi:MAG: hypothetical protein H0W41_09280 [Chloroflexi bacterium]|nr:hypothetical protein [Chloroflexota bacterium]
MKLPSGPINDQAAGAGRLALDARNTAIPNLWMASMFRVYAHDRGQNYSIALAEKLVKRILD